MESSRKKAYFAAHFRSKRKGHVGHGSGRRELLAPDAKFLPDQFFDEFETFYRNRGDGSFDEVTLDAGLG